MKKVLDGYVRAALSGGTRAAATPTYDAPITTVAVKGIRWDLIFFGPRKRLQGDGERVYYGLTDFQYAILPLEVVSCSDEAK